ncbi:hypothetical protein [Gloeocapsopsis dulcis]|uniref:Uncharacterized protein n=1 Tax=Gloeocapsopsis dulcis AAB1 = 1H9 TaxID=1433147 RepID=A0A6N8FVD4_9CHRO|nr:hypothetical protein [Gloeocapsopsis dulcis]MUL36734.1 hypothetical protein [Gloeocapsopsis dulcis AAB1 = 1H9]WNN91309.1 hypothetical protein P0S91_09650 [Gloeocapsopsis dulcis]
MTFLSNYPTDLGAIALLIIAIYLEKLVMTNDRFCCIFFTSTMDLKFPPAQSRATQATMLEL